MATHDHRLPLNGGGGSAADLQVSTIAYTRGRIGAELCMYEQACYYGAAYLYVVGMTRLDLLVLSLQLPGKVGRFSFEGKGARSGRRARQEAS